MARGWWRSHFTDHPLYDKRIKVNRPTEVWANAAHDKIRVYCSLCLDHDIGCIMQEEEARVRAQTLAVPRERREILLYLFNVPANIAHSWSEARSETLINYLRECKFQPESVRKKAQSERDSEETPKPRRTYHRDPGTTRLPPQPLYFQTSAAPPLSITVPPQISPPEMDIDFHPPPSASVVSRSGSFYSSESVGPSISRRGSPDSFYGSEYVGRKRSRVASTSGRRYSASAHSVVRTDAPWSDEQQKQFDERIIRLTASAGFPLTWTENPEWISFCEEFIPQARSPSRKVLTQRLLPSMLKKIRYEITQETKGSNATAQCDGWTGQNSHHFVAFMITVNGKLYTVELKDTTTERKTAENLLAMMEQVISKLDTEWGVKVIAFTTDASGESRKARRLLRNKCPHLVVPDCYAHQINLVVGDYFKVNGVTFLKHADRANDLITWLRSKTAVLGLIREALKKQGKQPLSIIRPVPTRWTAFYLAYRRLLDVRPVLEFLLSEDALRPPDERHFIPQDARARRKAEEMVQIMKDPLFWHSITRIKHHLAPLAIAANVTQSTFCRLDEVLLTFGSLVMEYSSMTDPEDRDVCDAIIASIEKRWSKSDQDVFIAAVMLNPFLKLQPFRKTMIVSMGSIHALFSRLWERFFNEEASLDLYDQIKDFFDNKGDFCFLSNVCNGIRSQAEKKNESPSPIQALYDIGVHGVAPTGLRRLGLYILSICPNSASCERLFSTFGLILTKLRTRLGTQNLLDLAELKMHLRDEHLRNNRKPHIKKRAFGIVPESGQTRNNSASSIPTEPSPTPLNPNNETLLHSTSESSQTNSSTQSLEALASSLMDMTNADEDPPSHITPSNENISVSIADLFDFSAASWIALQRRSAIGSLEAEMEFYDLVDLDAPAEPNLEPDLDDSIASLFTD